MESKLAILTGEVEASSDRLKTVSLAWNRQTFRRDGYAPALEALRGMAAGHDCCMYCGQNLADHIDHYVPVHSDPMKAFMWLNYLLACSTCNSRFKKGIHEVDSVGVPMLVNPTAEDPFVHLHLILDTGEYFGISDRGEYTVRTCGLNSEKRPDARRHALELMSLAIGQWMNARVEGALAEMDRAASVIRDQPFAAVFQSMLRQAMRVDADVLFSGIGDAQLLNMLRDPRVQGDLRLSV
ncbi:HNH endonuclease [Kitasatospora sp. NPDC088346]|uniref:HNH endonuclease n=1 Tax=Kitasatospora sp. NPDC088346 TaxID=3364073 RepID=UPI0037FE48BF